MRGFFVVRKTEGRELGVPRKKANTNAAGSRKGRRCCKKRRLLMPKRVVDGDALWRSDKLNQIELPSYRAEHASLAVQSRLLLLLRIRTVVQE